MKANSATKPGKFRVALISSALAVLAAGPATAANTDIANIPMANASSTTALPNIYFILDDSGSMAWKTLPGATSETQWVKTSGYWISGHCNGLAYDPTQTYTAPPALSSTPLKTTTFSAACNDGYDTTTACTTNLNNSYYYRYSGSQPDLGFTYDSSGNVITSSTFYTECNASTSALFTKVTLTSLSAEAQNYANWYSYYRTRISMAKSSIGAAFKDVRGTPKSYGVDPLDGDYFHARVGYDSIHENGSTALSLANFDTTQKTSFYDKLYKASASGDTPLRTALQSVGEMYKTTGASAPIQYRCQRNYAIVETDGYWNSSAPSLTPGNQDSSEPRPMYDGGTATGTKVETWQRYSYSTSATGCTALQTKLLTQEQRDLITTKTVNGVQQTPTDGGWNNYGSATSSACSASTTVPSPNPSTAVLLSTTDTPSASTGGSSNTLSDVAMYYYKTDLRSDLTDEVPAVHTTGNANIDDTATWQHMTTYSIGLGVNGTLTYDPNYKTTTDSSTAFYKILCPTGSGCSNWPVPSGDDAAAVDDLWHAAVDGHGTYFSAKNSKALAASLKQALGEMNVAAGAGAAASASSLNPTLTGDYGYTDSYVTGDWTGDVAAYAFQSTGDLATTATWSAATKLKTRIAAKTYADRTIYTSMPSSASMVNFATASFTTTTQKAWFDNSQLVQYSEEWAAAQKTAGTLDNLVKFLRGDSSYERSSSSADHQLYRTRKGPIGDIVHSQPVYVGKPSFNFEDTGYALFKANQASRAATIYAGANDGMLHAFDASDGSERWAYVPPMVLPNLWRLADRDYSGNHRYYVDGPIAVYDAYINGAWATVLIGAVGAGGRGYYALDVTNPVAPALLWTFSADDDPNVGYSFGTPLIAKVGGTWVAILASGYNNVPEASGTKYTSADGQGHVFIRKLSDGTAFGNISTGIGSAASPSGLATLNVQIKSSADYTAQAAYGGDLTGNMYRFDLAGGTKSTLIALGSSQPITSSAEIATVAGKPVVYFGTGEYLGKSDMTTTATQAIYAVKDDADAGGVRHTATKSELVQQTLSGGTITASSVDWGTKYGWYVELSSGERVNIHPQLQLGVVLFETTIPPATAADPCTAGGGTGWLYQFSYLNGGSVNGNSTIGTHLDYLPVGLSLSGTSGLGGTQLNDGNATIMTSKGTGVVVPIMKANGTGNTGTATRVLWRALLK